MKSRRASGKVEDVGGLGLALGLGVSTAAALAELIVFAPFGFLDLGFLALRSSGSVVGAAVASTGSCSVAVALLVAAVGVGFE